MRMPNVLLIAIVAMALAHSASAQVEVSLPLGGYFRPGKYMPVRVTPGAGADLPAAVRLSAPGAVPAVVHNAGGGAVVPFLPVAPQAGPVSWSTDAFSGTVTPSPLRALGPDERLVGVVGGADESFAERKLFPGRQVIGVELSAATPLPGPLVAWEALDAVLLDRFPEPAQVDGLLAAGTAIAVRSSSPPRDRWPWELVEGYWVLRRDVYGPRGALEPQAYDPAQMWDPGRPWAFRRQALLIVAVIGIATLGASLWRSRWSAGVVVGVALIGSILLVRWRTAQSPVLEANGAVLLLGERVTQRDDWIYRRSAEPNSEVTVVLPGLSKPVLSSAKQIDSTGLRLEASGAGDASDLRFHCRLSPRRSLAFLTRRVAPGRWPGEPSTPVITPTRALLPLYLRPGTKVLGQLADPLPGNEEPPAGTTRWDAVVVEVRRMP